MTVGEWLAQREPAPPAALHAHLAGLLAHEVERDASEVPALFLGAAERLVGELLRGDCASRESALDLLAADALITYAFEAAAESPRDLVPRAAEAMRRIALLGATARPQQATA